MPAAGAALRASSIAAGSCSISFASFAIGAGIVAQKNSVCRLRGQLPRGCGGCRAGSPCRACGRPRRAPAPRARRTSPCGSACGRAAGRASRRSRSTPLRKARCCGPIATPPYTAATETRVCLRQVVSVVRDLLGQLARGREHERAGLPARLGQQALEDGEQEGGGLAAARHSRSQHVTACEAGGNRLGLDRRGLFEAEVAERTRQARVQVQRGKRQRGILLRNRPCACRSFRRTRALWDEEFCRRGGQTGRRCTAQERPDLSGRSPE